MPVDCSVEQSRTITYAKIQDRNISADVGQTTSGAAAGYDPDGRRRLVGRRKTQGSANQIHATI